MSTVQPQRILIVDNNPIFRETLAQLLRDQGYDVAAAETGERAFLMLRDWSHPIDWLYTRAVLPGLIDGYVLADEYHDTCRERPVILSGSEAKVSSQGDLVLKQPSPAAVFKFLCQALAGWKVQTSLAEGQIGLQQAA